MTVKQYSAIIERRRHIQAGLLPAFDDIVSGCLKIAQGGRGTGDAFSLLQSYLDGRVDAGGVSYQRRSLLLAIHDMAQDREAPLALQRKALAQLIFLKMHPLPKLTLYRDMATAILRMEVVMRMAAAQAQAQEKQKEKEVEKEWKREPQVSAASLLHLEELGGWLHSSVETVSVGLATFRAALLELQAPRLPSLALSGLRYYFASGLRAVLST